MMFRGSARLPVHWSAVNDSLVFRVYPEEADDVACERGTSSKTIRVAGFDFDDTLVRKHDNSLSFPLVIEKLRKLREQGYVLAIFSNEALDHLKKPSAVQNAIDKKLKRLDTFAKALGCPIHMFVATKYDGFRKPSASDVAKKKPPGGNLMWKKMVELIQPDVVVINMEESIFVGDSSGRGGEFSDADLAFALCVGVKFIHAKEFFRANFVLKAEEQVVLLQSIVVEETEVEEVKKSVKTEIIVDLTKDDNEDDEPRTNKRIRTTIEEEEEEE